MHRLGALLPVETVHCCERFTTVKKTPGEGEAELRVFLSGTPKDERNDLNLYVHEF